MLRVPFVILFLATACAQELSQQELDPALAADDECASGGGESCGVELLQARASKDVKTEQVSSIVEMVVEGGEQLLQYNASGNASVNNSCLPDQMNCFSDSECCSGRCGFASAVRRCGSAR